MKQVVVVLLLLFFASSSSDPFLSSDSAYVPSNLHAKTSDLTLPSTSVNDLRFAFQMQRILERDAIYGTRLTEYIRSAFGVQAPDARLQRSEFLGGRRFPINVLQTVQTSSSTSQSPLGQVAGWSLTNGRSGYTKGFTEHGFVIGVFILRQFHTYQQGIERFWWKKKRSDYLDPLFSSIGYQPVFDREIYADIGDESEIFGYAPIYEDLRQRPNRISGQLSSMANEGLAIWHFGDEYDSVPILGQEFIEETSKFVDRTLSVSSSVVDQFIVDVYFKQRAIRVLPTYGMPGLIDHSH